MTSERIAVTGGPRTDRAAVSDFIKKHQYDLEYVEKNEPGNVSLRDSYDAVFFMASPALSEQIIREDKKLLQPWIGNPHLRVIEYRTTAKEQLDDLESEVAFFLGIPEPVEIERKYLIEYPDIRMLEDDPLCHRVEISQTYLKDSEGGYRVRKRGENGQYLYYLTRKKKISDLTRIETEERITEGEYLEHLQSGEKPLKTVSKSRYCLLYKNKYFEVDVFPFWDDKALMEIELKSEDEIVELPPQIKVIRDVSGEKEYTNRSIAEMRQKRDSSFYS